jgi:hypothetical protein
MAAWHLGVLLDPQARKRVLDIRHLIHDTLGGVHEWKTTRLLQFGRTYNPQLSDTRMSALNYVIFACPFQYQSSQSSSSPSRACGLRLSDRPQKLGEPVTYSIVYLFFFALLVKGVPGWPGVFPTLNELNGRSSANLKEDSLFNQVALL